MKKKIIVLAVVLRAGGSDSSGGARHQVEIFEKRDKLGGRALCL